MQAKVRFGDYAVQTDSSPLSRSSRDSLRQRAGVAYLPCKNAKAQSRKNSSVFLRLCVFAALLFIRKMSRLRRVNGENLLCPLSFFAAIKSGA